ncbi:polysaccharide deacetylase family protein [Actinomadura keratinilytica]|uniref:polysaccharide deacetylase family protein n=1 Tax=Actinomadura keratinilytica TaxID=547461 RepID=UPI003611EF99
MRKCVALTFDDGPGAYTGLLLDRLRAARVHATFFLLGQNVAGHRDLVRRMVEEGHEVGNHSWSHPDLTTLPTWEVRAQVRRTQQAVQDVTGVAPALFRPPYGAVDERVANAVDMPLILWSVDTLDWLHRDVRRNITAGVREPRRGGIVLFHDIHRPTVAAVPSVLEGLRERGFTFVTVSELFGGRPLCPATGTPGAEPKGASPRFCRARARPGVSRPARRGNDQPRGRRGGGAGGTTLAATTMSSGTSTTSPCRRRTRSRRPDHDSRTPTTSLYSPVGNRRRSEIRCPASAGVIDTSGRAARRSDM